MRISIDLVTSEGVRLEKGPYELKVKLEGTGYVLSFSSGGRVKAIIKPVPNPDPASSSAWIPVIGTHYLRPSTKPLLTGEERLLTGEERRFSKTGRAQYEEETRDWKATLRVYKTSRGPVFFVFESRGLRRQWNHVSFKLSQHAAIHKPDR